MRVQKKTNKNSSICVLFNEELVNFKNFAERCLSQHRAGTSVDVLFPEFQKLMHAIEVLKDDIDDDASSNRTDRKLRNLKKDITLFKIQSCLKLSKLLRSALYSLYDANHELLTVSFIDLSRELYQKLQEFDDCDDDVSEALDSLELTIEEAEERLGSTPTETALKLVKCERCSLLEIVNDLDFDEFFEDHFDWFIDDVLQCSSMKNGKHFVVKSENLEEFQEDVIEELLDRKYQLSKFPALLIEYVRSKFDQYKERLSVFDALPIFIEKYLRYDDCQLRELKGIVQKNHTSRAILSRIVQNNLQDTYTFEQLKNLLTKDDNKMKNKMNF